MKNSKGERMKNIEKGKEEKNKRRKDTEKKRDDE